MSWMHYNPQRADPALLDCITSGEARLELRDTLLELLRNEAGRTTHQHQLLIGARGAGKTHLLRVIAHRISQDSNLERRWRPVVLPEEQAIRGPSEIFGALLARLAIDLDKTDLRAARDACANGMALVGTSRGEPAMRLGFEGLKKVAGVLDRSILAVVENLDGLFFRGVSGGRKEAEREQWALRRCLQDADFLLLVGASPTRFGASSDPAAPFHGFFREHALDALPVDEVLEIARLHLELVAEGSSGTRSVRARDLADRFGANRGRLAGVLRVTGGLPRFAHLIVDLLIDSEDAEVEAQLERLLDEQTPYFQGRLDPRLIPAAELEALATLARASGPLRPSELARRVGISGSEISVLLERLRERGLARRSGSYGGATTWDVAEPLYRVWMAFREGGEQRSTMVGLTELVARLYSADELRERAEATSPGRASVWDLAMGCRAYPDGEPMGDAAEEVAFETAQAALYEAEANGPVRADVLITFVDAAWQTGRAELGRSRIEDMLAASKGHDAEHGCALLVAANFGGPDAVARYARAAKLLEPLDPPRAFAAKALRGRTLADEGHRGKALTILRATYKRALARRLPASLLSFVAVQACVASKGHEAKARWLERAEKHAIPESLDHANALTARARLAGSGAEERADLRARAAAIYRRLGLHADGARCQVLRHDDLLEAGKPEQATEALLEAADRFVDHDALLDVPQVWRRLRDLGVWGRRDLAARALRALAAGVNHERVRPAAEPALVEAATWVIAAREPTEAAELLESARDDLVRDRRVLLEPFVLNARTRSEDPEAVLLEQSEQMRAVVADVAWSVARSRPAVSARRPAWATTPAATTHEAGTQSPTPP